MTYPPSLPVFLSMTYSGFPRPPTNPLQYFCFIFSHVSITLSSRLPSKPRYHVITGQFKDSPFWSLTLSCWTVLSDHSVLWRLLPSPLLPASLHPAFFLSSSVTCQCFIWQLMCFKVQTPPIVSPRNASHKTLPAVGAQ